MSRHTPLGLTEHAKTQGCLQISALSLAETGLLSTRTGLSLARAALSIIRGSQETLPFYLGRGWMSNVKHASQKQCFHYASIKYLQYCLILAWQFDKSALCEQAVAGMAT